MSLTLNSILLANFKAVFPDAVNATIALALTVSAKSTADSDTA